MWDKWREYIELGGGGSWPRDAFESVLDEKDEEIALLKEAATVKCPNCVTGTLQTILICSKCGYESRDT